MSKAEDNYPERAAAAGDLPYVSMTWGSAAGLDDGFWQEQTQGFATTRREIGG
jgi:hypothetical protein